MDRGFLILTLWLGTSAATAAPQKLVVKTMTVCGHKLQVEIARDPAERMKGLMDRDSIPKGHGMLFVFDAPQTLTFWMKNVPFDIDIGFFDAKGALRGFQTMAGTSPLMREEALPRYESPPDSLYALEVPKAFFRKGDLKSCALKPLP